MSETKAFLTIAAAIVLVLGGGIAGCTYTVTENNRQYYETMARCVERGGTVVPSRGDTSSAACIAR